MQMAGEIDWEGLPPNVLLLIAGGRDALKAMRGVCHTWKDGFDANVSKIRVTKEGPPLPLGHEFAERYPGLTCLSFRQPPAGRGDRLWGLGPPPEEVPLGQLSCLPKLASLDLSGRQVSKSELEDVRVLPLVHLVLRRCQFNVLGRDRFQNVIMADSLESIKSLRGMQLSSLDLGKCKALYSRGRELLECLVGMPLVALKLDGAYDLRKYSALKHLRGMPLTCLDLDGCIFPNVDLEYLKGFPLTHLRVGSLGPQRNDPLNDAGLAFLLDLPLTSLSLESVITDAGMPLLRNLPLTDLTISNSPGVTDSGIPHLRGLPLTRLSLWGLDQISDTALEGLVGMPLGELGLDYCSQLTDVGLGYLHGLPLRRLSRVWCKKITRGGKEALRQAVQVSLTSLLFSGSICISSGLFSTLGAIRCAFEVLSATQSSFELARVLHFWICT